MDPAKPGVPNIDEIIARLSDLPALPSVAADLVSSMDDDDLDLNELVAKLERDQTLTTKTVRVANSPFFGLMGKVSSVQQAATVVGLRTIRSLAVASAMSGLRPPRGIDLNAYWLHAFQTALAARELARAARVAHEQAFLCGLIHDLGKLVMGVLFPEVIESVHALRTESNLTWSAAEQAIGLPSHSAVGAALARHWHFPEMLCQTIEHHHPPFNGLDGLAQVVHVADALAVAYSVARTGHPSGIDLDGVAFDGLGLSDKQLYVAARAMRHADGIADHMH
ncbi:MAG TPA: HDOD domain-containing protein [Rhodocyclaceae bacterium]|nr:HDOD domain-containing protein [Rhodocyclaceae bacterium]